MTIMDASGRATFRHIAPRSDMRVTNREVRWFRHIARHGPQSSQALFDLTADTHRCKDTALRQMQKLRAGGYLTLPPQQRAQERAEFQPYIYDLSRRAQDHLVDLGEDRPTVRPTGHWWHGYAVSQVTGGIDVAAARADLRYIPAHEILAIKGAALALPIGRCTLIPDQLFGLDYGGSYRAFALEVDRGTEPKSSPSSRKSWARAIDQYRQVIEQNLHKTHYGLKSDLLVLWVFSTPSRQRKFLEMVRTLPERIAASFLTVAARPSGLGQSDYSGEALFHQLWSRSGHSAVNISVG